MILDWNVERLTPDHIKELERYNKYEKKHRVQHFDSLAANYEALYLKVGYPDPAKVAENCLEQCNKMGKRPNEVTVLDMGCGTGLVGKYLAEKGFTNIQGCDLSKKMLEQAEAKGCYSRLDEVALGDPENFPNHLKNKFDIVTIAGLVNNNHLDYGLFEEMTLALKQNGLAIFAARYSYLGEYWYDLVLEEMVKEKRWKHIKSEQFFKYDQLE